MFLSEIFCKITVNSDFNRSSIRNFLQNCNKIRLGIRGLVAKNLFPSSVFQYARRFSCKRSKGVFVFFSKCSTKVGEKKHV